MWGLAILKKMSYTICLEFKKLNSPSFVFDAGPQFHSSPQSVWLLNLAKLIAKSCLYPQRRSLNKQSSVIASKQISLPKLGRVFSVRGQP